MFICSLCLSKYSIKLIIKILTGDLHFISNNLISNDDVKSHLAQQILFSHLNKVF